MALYLGARPSGLWLEPREALSFSTALNGSTFNRWRLAAHISPEVMPRPDMLYRAAARAAVGAFYAR
jgi:hypothetical protein